MKKRFYSSRAIARIVFLLVFGLLLCPAFSPTLAQAADAPKDFIFKGMPSYKIGSQQRSFNQLKIVSAKPDSDRVETETTYEGNLTLTRYSYTGPSDATPNWLQIIRHYQNSVKKLDGIILTSDKYEAWYKEMCASFIRNDKQYYMHVGVGHGGSSYTVQILEVEEMADDTEILDADTILHKLDTEGHIALYINFDTGKSTIKPESMEIIDEVVAALKSKPQLKVKLEGHTDNVGNAAANKKLSDDRAKAVMNAIIAKGIDKGRLSAEGFGLGKPIADNNTDAGRAKNRRVELVKVK